MKKIFLLMILLFPLNLLAQKHFKIEHIRFSSLFIKGLCDGTREALKFYPYRYPNNWNPANTWTNKYKNNDPKQGLKLTGSLYSDPYHTIGGIGTLNGLNYIGFVIYKFNNKQYKGKELWLKISTELILNFIIYNSAKTLAMNYNKK